MLQDSGVERSCDTPNKFFAGGVGDPSWTIDPSQGFAQEGVYVFFARDLSKPDSFTSPRKIRDGGEWYAQVVGDPDIRGTDSLAGEIARFFQHGTSKFRIVFDKPPEPPKR